MVRKLYCKFSGLTSFQYPLKCSLLLAKSYEKATHTSKTTVPSRWITVPIVHVSFKLLIPFSPLLLIDTYLQVTHRLILRFGHVFFHLYTPIMLLWLQSPSIQVHHDIEPLNILRHSNSSFGLDFALSWLICLDLASLASLSFIISAVTGRPSSSLKDMTILCQFRLQIQYKFTGMCNL